MSEGYSQTPPKPVQNESKSDEYLLLQKQIEQQNKLIKDIRLENKILKDNASKPPTTSSIDDKLTSMSVQKNLNLMMVEKEKLQDLVNLLRSDMSKLEKKVEDFSVQNVGQIKNNDEAIKTLQEAMNTLRYHSQSVIRDRENQIAILSVYNLCNYCFLIQKYVTEVVDKTSQQINSFRKVILEDQKSGAEAIFNNLIEVLFLLYLCNFQENDKLRKDLVQYQLKTSTN